MADGKVVIDVILEDGTVAKGVANLDKQLGGLTGAGKRAATGIKEIATALGLVALASKAIDMVKSSLDGAIDRYDTLNNFPRVLQQMGFDAEESQRAIQRLSDGVQGLPTTLDGIAKNAQRLAIMTGDLDGSVDTAIALNNAFIASGSSSADAARGLEQYIQMLSVGTVDLAAWRTLQETMGVALNDTAKAFGFTGKSAQMDLYEALKEGHITFDEFNAKIIELSNETGGFADRARTAAGGIKTAWTNMKTAVVRGVTNIIESIDNVLADTRFKSVENIISNIGKAFFNALDWIAKMLPVAVDWIVKVKNALEPWMPLIAAITAGILAFKGTISVINGVKNAIIGIKAALALLKATIVTNPFALLIAAVVALAVLIYTYWDEIVAFTKKAWSKISEFLGGIWDTVVEAVGNFVQKVVDWWNSVVEKASEIWNAVVEVIMTILGPFIETFSQMWQNSVDGLIQIWEGLKTFFGGIWDIIKNIFLGAILLIINLVTGNFEELKENAMAIWENIKDALSDIWDGIKQVFSGALDTIKENISLAWETVKNWTKEKFENVKTTISNTWSEIKTAIVKKLSEIVSGVKKWFTDKVNAIRDKMSDAKKKIEDGWNKAKKFLTGIDLVQIGKDIIQGLINGIKNKVKAVGDAVKNVTDQITGKIKSILKIKSPSQWMRDMIGKNMMLGWEIGINREKGRMLRKAEEMAEWITPDVTPVINRLRDVPLPLGGVLTGQVTHSIATSKAESSNIGIAQLLQEQNKLLQALLNKSSDVYLDGDKITDKVNENNAIIAALNPF